MLAHAERDRAGRDEGADGTEGEHEADAAEEGRPKPTERRPKQQAAHLRRAVEAECLATPLRRRRVGDVAAGRGIVDRRREPLETAQHDERAGADDDQRKELEDPRADVADDHERHPPRPIGQPAEDGFADQPGRRPRSDDDAKGPEIDAVLREVERHHRQ